MTGNTPGWAARPRAFVPTSPPERSAPGTRPAATSTSPSWPAACATRATAGPWAGSSPKTERRFHPRGSWRRRFVPIPPIGSRRREPMRCWPSCSTALPADGSRSRTTGRTRRSWPRPFGYQVPMTVHPGIGYDIIANHPMFNGVGHRQGRHERFPALRRLDRDLGRRGGAVDRLGDHGAAGFREKPQLRE